MSGPANFEIYRGANREWFWRLVAPNGKTIADGSESYKKRSGVTGAIARLKPYVAGAGIIEKIEG